VTYPTVRSEHETMALVMRGASLARYGDGEFALASGHSIPCQRHNPVLENRLRAILHRSSCFVGIPNLRPDGPKVEYWQKLKPRMLALVDPKQSYMSAFISRPDSAPWINTSSYWQALESLWVGQDVTLVRGDSVKALQPSDLIGANSVHEVICPRKDAFSDYNSILERVGTPARALLCLGPTATVLAVDLCARGVHAVDLGHCGMFLRKYRNGEPMVVTAADKAAA
jgi:hypothetical protein